MATQRIAAELIAGYTAYTTARSLSASPAVDAVGGPARKCYCSLSVFPSYTH